MWVFCTSAHPCTTHLMPEETRRGCQMPQESNPNPLEEQPMLLSADDGGSEDDVHQLIRGGSEDQAQVFEPGGKHLYSPSCAIGWEDPAYLGAGPIPLWGSWTVKGEKGTGHALFHLLIAAFSLRCSVMRPQAPASVTSSTKLGMTLTAKLK